MAAKRLGISRDLLIHPGETIADILDERGITQAELAARTGVTPAYISMVISGKKDISAKFAMSLEYALDIPKTFWINLQAHYDAELLEANEIDTITESERNVYVELADRLKILCGQGIIPCNQGMEENILSLRRYFRISNLSNLNRISVNVV